MDSVPTLCCCFYFTISIPLICRPLLILFRYRTYTYPLQLSCHIFSVWHTVPVPNRLSPYIMNNANCPVSAVFIWLSLAASTYNLLVVSLSTGPICPYCFPATTIASPGLLYSWLGNAELLKPPYHLQCSHDSSLLAVCTALLHIFPLHLINDHWSKLFSFPQLRDVYYVIITLYSTSPLIYSIMKYVFIISSNHALYLIQWYMDYRRK